MSSTSWRKAWAWVQDRLCNPDNSGLMIILVLLLEVVGNIALIKKIPYTEIDWTAYMSEVEGVVNGTYDYTLLSGGTGPLVYPAGFVYIYLGLYYATDHGQNIVRAQYLFAFFYLLTIAAVFIIYRRCRMPPYTLAMVSVFAYRVHSIFVLRLFNDPLAIGVLFAAVLFFMKRRWMFGCFLFSIAVSIKMNILLFSPGVLLLLILDLGLQKTIPHLVMCAAVQLVLGAPFLCTYPWSYLSRAFDFGRQFFYIWTVNWRCIPESVFLDRGFHLALLLLHLLVLVAFATRKWSRPEGGVVAAITFNKATSPSLLTNTRIALILFSSNFIGICFARSLHYQFYVWYYHSIPLLLWQTNLPVFARIAVILGIEYSFNVFPSTPWSSTVLHGCHAIILVALYVSPVWGKVTLKARKD